MKTHIQIGILILLSILLLGCGPSTEEIQETKKETYQKELAQLKKGYLEGLKEKFRLLESFRESFYGIKDVFNAEEHKEYSLRMGLGDREEESFNTLYLNTGYFLESAPFPIPYYKHLDNIERLVNNESLVWEEEGNLYPITELRKFRLFCENFINAEYIVLERALKVKDPNHTEQIVMGNGDGFTSGYYKTFVALFRFNASQQLLDNFILEATNDRQVEISNDKDLTYNLLGNVRKIIQKEMQARYSFSGEVPYRM